MKNKKTMILVIIIVLETIILGISLLYSSFIFFVKDARTEWFDEVSPDGKYHVKCYTVGSALFFSSQKLEIYFDTTGIPYVEGTNPVSFETELANDGANLYDENYSVEWLDTYVKIIFRGEETGGDNVFIIPYYKSGNIENVDDTNK